MEVKDSKVKIRYDKHLDYSVLTLECRNVDLLKGYSVVIRYWQHAL